MQACGPSSISCVPLFVCLFLFLFLFLLFFLTGQTSLSFLFTSTKINKQIIIIIRKKEVELYLDLMFSPCFVFFTHVSLCQTSKHAQTTRILNFPQYHFGFAIYSKKFISRTIYQRKPCKNLTIKPKSLQPLSLHNATKLQKKIKSQNLEKSTVHRPVY